MYFENVYWWIFRPSNVRSGSCASQSLIIIISLGVPQGQQKGGKQIIFHFLHSSRWKSSSFSSLNSSMNRQINPAAAAAWMQLVYKSFINRFYYSDFGGLHTWCIEGGTHRQTDGRTIAGGIGDRKREDTLAAGTDIPTSLVVVVVVASPFHPQ